MVQTLVVDSADDFDSNSTVNMELNCWFKIWYKRFGLQTQNSEADQGNITGGYRNI